MEIFKSTGVLYDVNNDHRVIYITFFLYQNIQILQFLRYGHVTPSTWEGQVVCICYTVIGIPMFGLIVIGWSKVFSNVFDHCFAVNTRRLSSMSHLLPAKIIATFSGACC